MFTESVIVLEKLGDLEGIALSTNNIGVIYLDQKMYKEAEPWFHRSLESANEAGSALRKAAALVNLGLIASHRNEYQKAIDLFSTSTGTQKKTERW